MSVVSNLFKSNSNYILDVSTGDVDKKLKRKNFINNWSIPKKVATGALAVAVLGLTLTGGFLTTMSSAPEAKADWIGKLVCGANGLEQESSPWRYLGGRTNEMANLQGGVHFSNTNNGITPISMEINGETITGGKTGYETYGPWTPSFTGWIGLYDNGDKTVEYDGTGGKATSADTSIKGNKIDVPNPTSIPLFSHSAVDCIGVTESNALFANFVFLAPKAMTWVSAELFGFAYSNTISNESSPIHAIFNAIEKIIVGDGSGHNGLKDQLYLPFLTPVIMIGAISLLYIGVVKRSSTAAFQAGLWMVGAAIGGLLFVSKPLIIPNTADLVVNSVTNATNKTIISDPDANTLCNVGAGTDQETIVREVRCGIWYNSVYVPWVTGQFGVTPTSSSKILTNDPRHILSDKQNWAVYQLKTNLNNSQYNQSEIAYAQLSGDGMDPNGTWGGASLGKPLGSAFLALVASIGSGTMIIASSFALLAYQFIMIMLVLLSPFFFLIGAAPGFGRRIAMRWLELITGLVIKRMVVSLILALFLRFYNIIMGLPDINYLFQLILILIVSFICLTQRKTITNLFTDAIDFGGDKRINVEGQGGGTAGRVFAGLAGAAVGAMGAGVAAGKITEEMVSSTFGKDGVPAGGNTAPTRSNEAITPPVAKMGQEARPLKTTPAENFGEKVVSSDEDSTPTKVLDTPVTPPVSPSQTKPVGPQVPAGVARPIPKSYSSPEELEKLNRDLRKKAIRKGAIQGAQQGFAAGKINAGSVYGAAQIGANVGDTVYDNEQVKLDSAGKNFRERETLDLFGRQVEAMEGTNVEQERRHKEMLDATRGGSEVNAAEANRRHQELLSEQQRTRESQEELETKQQELLRLSQQTNEFSQAARDQTQRAVEQGEENRRTSNRIDRKINDLKKTAGNTNNAISNGTPTARSMNGGPAAQISGKPVSPPKATGDKNFPTKPGPKSGPKPTR